MQFLVGMLLLACMYMILCPAFSVHVCHASDHNTDPKPQQPDQGMGAHAFADGMSCMLYVWLCTVYSYAS